MSSRGSGIFFVIQRERQRPKDLNHSRPAFIMQNEITPSGTESPRHNAGFMSIYPLLYLMKCWISHKIPRSAREWNVGELRMVHKQGEGQGPECYK